MVFYLVLKMCYLLFYKIASVMGVIICGACLWRISAFGIPIVEHTVTSLSSPYWRDIEKQVRTKNFVM